MGEPNINQRLAQLSGLTRLVLAAVADRRDHEGVIQAGMSRVQVSILAIADLAERLDARADAYAGKAWLLFRGMLGLLDADAWRLLDCGEQPPEAELANFEHGLRYLVELAERTATAAAQAQLESSHG